MMVRNYAGLVCCLALVSGTAEARPHQTQSPAILRARATLARMTTDEKVTLLHGPMLGMVPQAKRPPGVTIGAGYIPGIARLGIPALVESDASLGVANLGGVLRKGDVATALPSGLALAATWNPDLVYAGGKMIGSEARAKGFNVLLAGGVNLVRDPRGGRTFEYLGEDPLLAGRLVAAQIGGVQSNHIMSTIKHFALNDQETGRNIASVNFDEASARESDLLAFELGIEGGHPGAVMCSYNRVGDTYACENRFLLTDVLRRDWGFSGFVMSDWGAVHSVGALTAGLDQESGEALDTKRFFSTELSSALLAGEVPMAAVDRATLGILTAIYSQGLVDHPVIGKSAIDYAADGAVALRAEQQGIVLLRNQDGILPLKAHPRTILLVGGHGDLGVLSGGGSSQVSPVGGLRRRATATGSFTGYGYGGTPPLEALRTAFPDSVITYIDSTDLPATIAAAAKADIAVVIGEKFSSEGVDVRDLSLGGGQDDLIAAVAGANPNTVVVLETGNPVVMPWRDKVAAILEAWYPGQSGGTAVAQVLSGAVNPSGHLPVTFPADFGQIPNPVLPGSTMGPPSKQDKALYGSAVTSPTFDIGYPEGSDVGYRWYDARHAVPLYPFGFGLSYTHFAYAGLQAHGGAAVRVTFRVTNTGTAAGADVPQVYVTLPGKARRLIGWSRTDLAPGQTRTVTVVADRRLLARYSVQNRGWLVAAGPVKVEVSRAATDPVLTASVRIAAAQLQP